MQPNETDFPSNPFGSDSDGTSEDPQEDSSSHEERSHFYYCSSQEEPMRGPQRGSVADHEEKVGDTRGIGRVRFVSRAGNRLSDSKAFEEKDGFLAFDAQDPIVPFFSLSRPTSTSTALENGEDIPSSLCEPVRKAAPEEEPETRADVSRRGEDDLLDSERGEDGVLMTRQGRNERNKCRTEGLTSPASTGQLTRASDFLCQVSGGACCGSVNDGGCADVSRQCLEVLAGGGQEDEETLPVSGQAGRETRELPVSPIRDNGNTSVLCRSLGLQSFRIIMRDPLRLHTSEELVFELGIPPEWGGGIRDSLQEDEMQAWRESGEKMMEEATQKQQQETQEIGLIEDRSALKPLM